MPKRKSILDSLRIDTVDYDQPHSHINDPNNQAGRLIDSTFHVCSYCKKPFKRLSQMKNCEKLCASKRPVELSDSSSDFQPSPAKREKRKNLNRSLPLKQKKTSHITKTTSASTSLQSEYKSPTHIDNLKNSINPNTPPKSPAVNRKEPGVPTSNNESISNDQEYGPKSVAIDHTYEAQTETDKFKSIPIRAKLLTDLPPNEVDRYPNHTHYMLFISGMIFTSLAFLTSFVLVHKKIC